ncbi:MAG: hypothetical protein FWG24_02455, partial [Eggerthellaceae bacterium]|nr:hypothetical protein [Eggerthellaceae bacterium]
MFARKREKRGIRACVQLAVALTLVISWPGLLPNSLTGAYAADSTTIIGFERKINPVYTEGVEYGTARDALGLPKTLRAVCEIAEISQVGFVQTAPVPDKEDNFDYYWYGYVAPRGEANLRFSGELVIYTIYYADGTQAFRVH